MSSPGTVIPREIEAFNAWITTTNAYLLLNTLVGSTSTQNATRFGFGALSYNSTTQTILQAFQAYLAQWQAKYPAWLDKKGQRSEAVTNALHLIIDALVADDKTGNKYIQKIKATSVLTALDCTTFNLPVKLASPLTGGGSHVHTTAPAATARTIPTSEQVFVKLIPVGGNQIKCKCYKKSTDKRAGKLKGFDLVEVGWAVFPNVLPAGTLLPTDAGDSRLTAGHSTKADFLQSTGTGNAGKTFIAFFRWAKSKHPTLDGPWSGPFTCTVL
jgi:hypothetical protein